MDDRERMQQDEIDRLAEHCRAGDEEAFVLLVRRTERWVSGLVYRLLGDLHETEEVVQDVYVAGHRELARWEGRARFTTWLYRAAVRGALERRRSRKRYQARLEAAWRRARAPESAPGESGSPAEAREIGQAVREAVLALPDLQRETFVLRHYQNLPIAEIARVREVAVGTVKAQLFQAVRNLRRALAPWVEDSARNSLDRDLLDPDSSGIAP